MSRLLSNWAGSGYNCRKMQAMWAEQMDEMQTIFLLDTKITDNFLDFTNFRLNKPYAGYSMPRQAVIMDYDLRIPRIK